MKETYVKELKSQISTIREFLFARKCGDCSSVLNPISLSEKSIEFPKLELVDTALFNGNEKLCLQFLDDIKVAVFAMRKNAVLHLDLKPANILIRDGKFVLTDFGNAHDMFDQADHISRVPPRYRSTLPKMQKSAMLDSWSLVVSACDLWLGCPKVVDTEAFLKTDTPLSLSCRKFLEEVESAPLPVPVDLPPIIQADVDTIVNIFIKSTRPKEPKIHPIGRPVVAVSLIAQQLSREMLGAGCTELSAADSIVLGSYYMNLLLGIPTSDLYEFLRQLTPANARRIALPKKIPDI